MLFALVEIMSLVPIIASPSSEPHGVFYSLLNSADTCTTHALTNHTQSHTQAHNSKGNQNKRTNQIVQWECFQKNLFKFDPAMGL